MIAQRYTISIQNEDAEPGQFVFPDNDTDFVSGFIYDVTQNSMEIVLFEPADLTELEDIITSYEKAVDWPSLLLEALEKNPKMKEYWFELVEDTETNPTLH